jgi:hypothetical protein
MSLDRADSGTAGVRVSSLQLVGPLCRNNVDFTAAGIPRPAILPFPNHRYYLQLEPEGLRRSLHSVNTQR